MNAQWQVGMVGDPAGPQISVTHEIRLRGAVPATLLEQFPGMRLYRYPAVTVLYRDMTELRDLDVLLEHLQSMGLTFSAIRQRPVPSASLVSGLAGAKEMGRVPHAGLGDPPSPAVLKRYEVHIVGRLGAPLLAYLDWASITQPEQYVARLESTPGQLPEFLASCWKHGLRVERVARIDPMSAAPDASTSLVPFPSHLPGRR
jgi:hypothetical protein